MTLGARTITQEARVLRTAERDAVPIAPLSQRHASLSTDDAYEIQRELTRQRRASGERIVGRKVGLTSAAMQRMLGVDQPDYGVIFESMLIQTEDDLVASELIAPRVEPEIAFELATPLEGEVDEAAVLAATARVAPAIEIIDSRIADWEIALADTIADNASSARVVCGEWVELGRTDLRAELVSLSIGQQTRTGTGQDVLGHPAAAVAWLVKTLAAYGERLDAGSIVLPGAMTAALPIRSGDRVLAVYSTLGSIELTVR